MKVNRVDFVIPVIAGLTVFLIPLNIPVWALFFGFTWYFLLGTTPEAFKLALPPMFVGYISAGISSGIFVASNYNVYALAIAVGLTVFVMMLTFKVKLLSNSFVTFNAYSCMFAGYFSNSFPKVIEGSMFDFKNILIAMAWIGMANILGLIAGWLSITLGNMGNKVQA